MPIRPDLRARFDALSPRERRLLGLLAFALLVFALWLLLRGGEGEEPPVELAAAPPPANNAPAPVAYVPPPAPIAPPAPAASASGLMLVGIFGGGPGGGAAILQAADGSQRLVRIGREFQPGTSLRSVGINHVVIAQPGGDLRLEIGKAGGTPVAAPVAVAAAAPPSPAPAGGPSSEQMRRETLQYQLGMEPASVGGQSGYRIKPGARLPHLDRAGLQPGDVIVGINGGNGFTDERLMEMSYDINTGARTEFDVVRNGRRIRLAIER